MIECTCLAAIPKGATKREIGPDGSIDGYYTIPFSVSIILSFLIYLEDVREVRAVLFC